MGLLGVGLCWVIQLSTSATISAVLLLLFVLTQYTCLLCKAALTGVASLFKITPTFNLTL